MHLRWAFDPAAPAGFALRIRKGASIRWQKRGELLVTVSMSKHKKGRVRLLYPAESGWMLADVLSDGSVDATASVKVEPPVVAASGERLVVALPARYFATVLVPVTAPDEETRDAALQLQLEKLGLLQEGRASAPASASCEAGAVGDERTMLAVLLDDQPPEAVCIEGAERFEPAPRLLHTAPATLALYGELGSLVAVWPSPSGGTAYFQMLSSGALDEEAVSELALLVQSVSSLPGLPAVKKIALHVEAQTRAMQLLADATGLEVVHAGEVDRALPSPAWNLLPHRVVTMRAASVRRRAIRAGALAVMSLVLAAVGGMAWHYARLSDKAAELRDGLARVESDVMAAASTAALWQEMRLALEPELYPIERLYQATRLLPDEGVRLTVFEQRGTGIVLSGEASSTPAAIKFANDLKRSPEWGGYTFEIPQPKIMPNNSAQFRVTARAPGEAVATPETP